MTKNWHRVFVFLAVCLVFSTGAAASKRAAKHLDRPAINPSEIKPFTLSEAAWREQLTPAEYHILREDGTEGAYTSPLNDEKGEGYFVCAGCHLALFHSRTKYESHTGWPSFWDVIPGRVEESTDFKLIIPRTEYHCRRCGGHQGHIFKDGPEPTGLRYCNNGRALKFISQEKPTPATEEAIFAGGCFWCMEKPFDTLDGVISTVVGYTGGKLKDPTYEQVSEGHTGHLEAVKVVYDPQKITYQTLLKTFWVNIDPLDDEGQFCDKGPMYHAAIFFKDEIQRKQALKSLQGVEKKLKAAVQTKILERKAFYKAEKYHQDYYKKNPWRYDFYRASCKRDDRLKKIWGQAAHHARE